MTSSQISPEPGVHIPCSLPELAPGSEVLLSSSLVANTAVVFVHGHGGDPHETWAEFHDLMDSSDRHSWWSRCDAYFLSYDYTSHTDDTASYLETVLQSIYPSPAGELQQMLDQRVGTARTYKKLVLVGHSEGGIVLRSCIAELAKHFERTGEKSPILEARLVLFAPALFGFMPTGWLGVLAKATGIRQLLDLYVGYSPAASEMVDMETLRQLRDVTQKLFDHFPELPALSAHVVFGEGENVVAKARYYQDYKVPPVPKKDHFTICKPTKTYLLPLFLVQGDL